MKPTITRWFGFAVLALLCLGTSAGFAQSITTAAITGKVTSATGEALPGANVIAVHTPSGTTYGTSSRNDGRFGLPGLRVGGPYTISATLSPTGVLSNYAITYNLRHHRHGHLFQNRYKSIVCDEDTYCQELVRYIHLNPLRANLVKDLEQLDRAVLLSNVLTVRSIRAEPAESMRAEMDELLRGNDDPVAITLPRWSDIWEALCAGRLAEARAGRFTEPANSVKSTQYEAALRVYYVAQMQSAFPDLFSDQDIWDEIRFWNAAKHAAPGDYPTNGIYPASVYSDASTFDAYYYDATYHYVSLVYTYWKKTGSLAGYTSYLGDIEPAINSIPVTNT
jgi:hypothetical protein